MTLPTLPKAVFNHVFMWIVALLHLHIMLYKHSGTVKAGKLSGCPFVKASSFFGRHTAFITNSLLFRNPSAIVKLSMKSDANSFFRSSNIAQYALSPEALSEMLEVNTKESPLRCTSARSCPTTKNNVFRPRPTTFNPNAHLTSEEKKQEKEKMISSEELEVVVIGEYFFHWIQQEC